MRLTSMSDPGVGRGRREIMSRVMAWTLLVAFVAGACGSGSEVRSDVAAQLDVPNEAIAVLGESSSEPIARLALQEAVDRAADAGFDLRIVVSGDGEELVNAASVADAYGGTALTYKTGDVSFEAASRDLTNGQLNRAADAARSGQELGSSAQAFVDFIAAEGPERKGWTTTRIVLWVAFILAGLFFLSQVVALLRSRRQAARRRAEFDERLDVLRDWSARIDDDARSIGTAPSQLDAEHTQLLAETQAQLASARTALANASTLAELDANEIRVARAAMKLRVVRQQLG